MINIRDLNQDELVVQYLNLAFSILVASTPVDTRNLLNHTVYEIGNGYATITISAPSKYGDYAYYVNYNRRRGAKEVKNYHYVENSLKQAANIIASSTGGNVYVI